MNFIHSFITQLYSGESDEQCGVLNLYLYLYYSFKGKQN